MAEILIVDDVRDNIALLRDLLEDDHHEIHAAMSGAEALKMAAEISPDLVLLDILMPEMDGFEVCRRMKDTPELARIPVVMISALDREDDMVRGLDEGAVDFITKPISEPLVLARVRSAIRMKASDDVQEKLTVSLEETKGRLESTVTELERSNAELDQFAYVVSHDLQEPLRTITSFVQLLERQYQQALDDKAREYIAFAVGGSKRMSGMLKDLLDYSRVGTGGIRLEPVDLAEVFATAAANLESAIADSAAELELFQLPIVSGSRAQLTRLFQNLLSNAIKYRGKETPKIQVSAKYGGEFWRISVEDNGIGIPADAVDRVFQVFQRLHTRREYPGTGIGLAIAKRIATAHGGKIWAEPNADQGTTLCVELMGAEAIDESKRNGIDD